MSPILRTYKNNNELPSAGQVFKLDPGLNRFGFTGQLLIDWELYTFSDENQQFQIGNWADNWHQEVPNFEERQHILRIKGNGPFTTIILPYRKGEKPEREITQEGDNIRIKSDNEDILIHRFVPYFYSYQSPDVQILANMDTGNALFGDMSIEGGQAEVVVMKNRATITIHGYPGFRKIKIPGIWKTGNSGDLALTISQDYTTIGLDYSGGKPLTFSMER